MKKTTVVKKKKRIFHPEHVFIYVAGSIIFFLLVCAVFPQWVAPYAPTKMFTDAIMQAPSATHILGTDYFGRDVFSLIVFGSRTSLIIGILSVIVAATIGMLIGSVAGYAGGMIDLIFMRIIDILMTIPGMLLSLAFAAALGPSLMNIILAISISAVPGYARLMRGQILTLKRRNFVIASKSIGVSDLVIFFRHILPNAYSPLLVMATNGLGSSILLGAGLSFLGLGIVQEVPDWGTLLSQGRGYLAAAWWIATFPGIAITSFVLSANIIGDSLRDFLDPKKQQKGENA
ncbi:MULTISPECIES: ABC transporter permease [Bacillaceae]|uniref:ABC transporter permease n=1 Tax=Niallia sp. Man26 TaxID=2912824 RepID=UPI001E622E56|nr:MULTISPECIES: ABC transporter permease [Bacillaceae]MCE4050718.1 ABC transporter permease [Bacillus sp. Au-Bac7]MCM3031661.1 ABC transporter permease [Niallia sp. MER 6]UPO90921.1 ABC transporter permease [Niallia sp. Man26]